MSDIVIVLRQAMTAAGSIAAFVGDRIYPGQLPDAPLLPALVITKAAGLEESDFEGDTMLELARVQIDVFGEGYAQVCEIKEAVRRFVVSRPPPGPSCVINAAQCITDMDLPAPAFERAGPRVRRRTLEFNIWTRRV